MKAISFLLEFMLEEIKIILVYSLLPSIGLGMIPSYLFICGFPIGIIFGIGVGILNGFILGILVLVLLYRLENQRVITYIFMILSVMITFVWIFIFTYRMFLSYVPDGLIPNYDGFTRSSVLISLTLALIVGYANHHLANWYLEYRKKTD